MSDTALNRFIAYGTNADRLAFTPDPPVPASGPNNLYLWFTSDTKSLYAWDLDVLDWVLLLNTIGAVNNVAATTYTLDVDDLQNTVALSNGSGCVITIPDNATEPFPVNAQIAIVSLTAGEVQIVPDGGVTLIARDSFDKMAGLGAIAILIQVAIDEWVFNGDTAA